MRNWGGRRGLEVKRAPGDQGVRGSNPAYSFFLFLDFEEQLENVFFIAESGSVERNADKKDDVIRTKTKWKDILFSILVIVKKLLYKLK